MNGQQLAAASDMNLGNLWNAFLNCSQFGVFWKDSQRRFLGCNQFFLDYYGFRDVSVILGKTDEDMGWHIHEEKFQKDEWEVINKGAITVNVLGTCICRGKVRDIAASKFPVRDSNGKIIGLMGFFRDVQSNALSRSEQDLMARLSRVDELSGLQNSIGKQLDHLKYEEEYRLKGTDFAEIKISISNLRDIENTQGIRFGERVIKSVAQHLLEVCGQAASISRISDGDFVILKQCREGEDIEEIVRCIRDIGKLALPAEGPRPEVLLKAVYSLFSGKKKDRGSAAISSDKAMTEKIVQRMLGMQFECMAIINAHTQMMYYHYFGTSIPASRWQRYGDVARGVSYEHVMKTASKLWVAPDEEKRMYSLTKSSVLLEQMAHHAQYILKVKVDNPEPGKPPLWKQMRYSWLDDNHEWILYDQTDVTESTRLEQAHLAEANEVRAKLSREHGYAIWAHVKSELLMQIPGVASFDYNPDTDILDLDVCRHDGTMERRHMTDYLRGGHYAEWLDPSCLEAHDKEWQSALREAKQGVYDIALWLGGDKPEWYKVTYRSVADQDGRVIRLVARAESVQNYISSVDEWRERATRDSLTGLLNHSYALQMISRDLTAGKPGSLLMIDVDKFKTLNDKFGHQFGDYVLIEFSQCIKAVFRETDILGRYGGDEFIVFLRGMVHRPVLETKLQRLNESVRAIGQDKGAYVAASIGAIIAESTGSTAEKLVEQADKALYVVKQAGGNGHRIISTEQD